MSNQRILVTGATGYIGGRLAKRLLQGGHRVTAMARSLGKLGCRPWAAHPNVRLVRGDVMDPASLDQALAGCDAAYYLVHSMTPGAKDFADADRVAARNMAEAATRQGVRRIIYLGGLGEESDPNLSKHLRSRLEVAKVLEQGGVPVTFLRAALVSTPGKAGGLQYVNRSKRLKTWSRLKATTGRITSTAQAFYLPFPDSVYTHVWFARLFQRLKHGNPLPRNFGRQSFSCGHSTFSQYGSRFFL